MFLFPLLHRNFFFLVRLGVKALLILIPVAGTVACSFVKGVDTTVHCVKSDCVGYKFSNTHIFKYSVASRSTVHVGSRNKQRDWRMRDV